MGTVSGGTGSPANPLAVLSVYQAALLDALTPFFDQGTFRAPIIDPVISLADGRTAYEQVARGEARGRLVLVP